MSTNSIGKQRLIINLFSNFSYVALNSLVIVLITPYLVNKLGVGVYGLIPLVVSFVAYFNIFTMSIASSLNRYVTLHYHKHEYLKCNKYINSALWPLIYINILLVVPVFFISLNISSFINIPEGFEQEVSLLFVLVMLGAFTSSISAPFMAGIYIRHRFDLDSLVKILAKTIQISIIFVLFEMYEPKLRFYGLSYFGMAVTLLMSMMFLQRKLIPELHVNYRMFNKYYMLEMSNMSFWTVINQVGSLLYITIAIVLVNILLGPEVAGKYAAIVQWVTLLGVLGGSISSVFIPIAYEYIAKNDIKTLAKQLSRSVRYIALIIGYPVSFLSGASEPILVIWLGDDFSGLSNIMWIMLAPWVITVGVRPLFGVFTGMNKVVIPAIVTLTVGLVNILSIYIFVKILGYGLEGVALSLLLCFSVKNMFFTTIYSAIITKQKLNKYIYQLIPGILMSFIFSVLFYFIWVVYDIRSLPELIITGVFLGFIYMLVAYDLFVTKSDKRMFLRMLLGFIKKNNVE